MLKKGFWVELGPLFFDNPELYRIVGRTLLVSGVATLVAVALGVPLGFLVGTKSLPGRRILLVLIHAGMGLPTVLVGLLGILILGRDGPLGSLQLLYTPVAMVLAQAVIALPLIASVTCSAVQSVGDSTLLQIRTLGGGRLRNFWWIAREARLGLLAAVMAGFGIAISEVGAALMVGGNLRGSTRVLTTATLLEARVGRFERAIGLGFLLLLLTLFVSVALTWLQQRDGSKKLDGTDLRKKKKSNFDKDYSSPAFAHRTGVDEEAESMISPVIEVMDLEKEYGGNLVVSVKALQIGMGETLAILGPNGSGKSTLLRLLSGLERPSQGSVHLEGRPFHGGIGSKKMQRKIAFVPQDPPMLWGSVEDNISAPLRARGLSRKVRRSRTMKWLDRIQLEERAGYPAGKLSGGERRRVALARALAAEPSVVLLDEPFVSLDGQNRELLIQMVRESSGQEGFTTVLVTQERDIALRLADRIAILWEGTLGKVGSPEDVLNHPGSLDLARFLGSETVVRGEVIIEKDGVMQVQVGDLILEVVGKGEIGGAVWICICPENVALNGVEIGEVGSVRNRLFGTIVGLESRGLFVHALVDVGFVLRAAISNLSAQELKLAPGMQVQATVKATAIHCVG